MTERESTKQLGEKFAFLMGCEFVPMEMRCGPSQGDAIVIDGRAYEISVESVRYIMERVGLWNEFVWWHRIELSTVRANNPDESPAYTSWFMHVLSSADADILTDSTLLSQACIFFMEGRDA